ncbi:DMT family transporter [Acetobacter thailandicus]|uniref:DMT family transporter n=1 Tax=Acetobacter thailandicus TaxID=1502842 RepID=UPI00201301E4|nr:DMT family transporter [Acetobacter thailandicus]
MQPENGVSVAPVMGGREWIMLAVLAFLWGASFFFFKIMVAAHLPVFLIVFGRVFIAALILNIWLMIKRDMLPHSWAMWRDFIILGIFNNAVPFALIVCGEQRLSSGLASILNATTPVFTIIVAHFYTETEKLSLPKIAGIAAGFAGVMILVGGDLFSAPGGHSLVGELASLGAAVSYAIGGVFGKRFSAIPPLKIATGQITSAALVLLPLVLLFDHPWQLPMPGLDVWGALIGISFFSTVIGYILFFHILAVAGATNVLLVTFLVPVTALLLGWGILGEVITARSLLGMAVIGLGLASIDGRIFKYLKK